MNQIILASHGGLAAGAKDTLEMVLGDVSNVHVVSLARDDKEPITNKVETMIATFNADDTVYVLTDMLGSSVNNSMVELSRNGAAFTVISGFNIPLALTLAMSPAPVKGAELAALINEARTGLTNPNAPVEVAPAAPVKKAKAPRHNAGPAKIVLARLDYRLLHGQVVFTWTTKVQAERIIVVDNAAANDDIKKDALKLAKPQGVRLNVFTVERALAKMDKLNTLGERVMFIFGNTAEMLQFCQGYKLDVINLGATANHDGADQIGGKDSSVFFDDTQKADVNQLLDMGIKLYVQQTPTYQSVDIDAKL
ncbi:PTS mannose/fructose/sorbose transporter subunit IIAB [Collinsella aerofaciens]|uniref:PTS mannose/fructose/sorbose transporter subunit IIAB n=1 Tax=Collinsella aerofaciens TaxID=74426 RepID=UPI0034A5D4FD